MNREDQDFGQLRRLVKLKRYEQPPPRYFNDFSARVLAGIRASEASRANASWWRRLWAGFELRPALPVALSAAVCVLLILGAAYTEAPELHGAANVPGINLGPPVGGEPMVLATFDPASPVTPPAFSTNPVPAPDSLFNRIPTAPSARANHPLLR